MSQPSKTWRSTSSTRNARCWTKLLSPQEPAAIHAAVLATCGQYDSPDVAELVLSQWPQFAPSERSQATDVLLRRGAWALALVQHLAKENVRITTLDPAHVSKLENYPSAKVREIARKLRGQGVTRGPAAGVQRVS